MSNNIHKIAMQLTFQLGHTRHCLQTIAGFNRHFYIKFWLVYSLYIITHILIFYLFFILNFITEVIKHRNVKLFHVFISCPNVSLYRL